MKHIHRNTCKDTQRLKVTHTHRQITHILESVFQHSLLFPTAKNVVFKYLTQIKRNQPTNQPNNQPTNQPTNRSINQSVSQSDSQSVSKSDSQSVSQSVNQSINRWIATKDSRYTVQLMQVLYCLYITSLRVLTLSSLISLSRHVESQVHVVPSR